MKIKIKKVYPDAILPTKANETDAGFDCYAYSCSKADNYLEYNLGFQIEIPENYFGLLAPRSSITNYDLMVKNSVGIIDSGYRGDVKLRTKTFGENIYKIGDRVCQLIVLPLPKIELEEVDTLDDNNDRKGGFGSTGVSSLSQNTSCDCGCGKQCDCQ